MSPWNSMRLSRAMLQLDCFRDFPLVYEEALSPVCTKTQIRHEWTAYANNNAAVSLEATLV